MMEHIQIPFSHVTAVHLPFALQAHRSSAGNVIIVMILCASCFAHAKHAAHMNGFTCAWRCRARLLAARAACSAGRRPRGGTPRAASRSPRTRHPPARSPAAGRLRPSGQTAITLKKECICTQSGMPNYVRPASCSKPSDTWCKTRLDIAVQLLPMQFGHIWQSAQPHLTFAIKGDARAALPAGLDVHAQRFLHTTVIKLSTQAAHSNILYWQQLTQLI